METRQTRDQRRRKQTLPPSKGLSLEEKVAILNKLKEGRTVVELAILFKCTEMAIHSVKKAEKRIRRDYRPNSGGKRRRVIFKKLDKLMCIWVNDEINRKYQPTPSEVRRKAVSLFHHLKAKTPIKDSFSASTQWYHKFAKKAKLKAINDEADGVHASAVETLTKDLIKIIKEGKYKPEQIFNCDETTLCWKKLPENSALYESNDNCNRDRMTVLFCANASGDYKCKPLVVYHDDTSLGETDKDSLPVYWRTNKNSWMSPWIFADWFEHCFVPEVAQYLRTRAIPFKILLICDSSVNHSPSIADVYPNVKVAFIPPRRSADLFPLKKGIFFNFYLYYHKGLLTYLAESMEKSPEKSLEEHWAEFNVEKSLSLIEESWYDLYAFTMMSGWKKLLPVPESASEERHFLKSRIEEIANLSTVIGGTSITKIYNHLHSHDSEIGFSELELLCSAGQFADKDYGFVNDSELETDDEEEGSVSHEGKGKDVEANVETEPSEVSASQEENEVAEKMAVDEGKKENTARKNGKRKKNPREENSLNGVEEPVLNERLGQFLTLEERKRIALEKSDESVETASPPMVESSDTKIYEKRIKKAERAFEEIDIKSENLTVDPGIFEPSKLDYNWELGLDEFRISVVKEEPVDEDEPDSVPEPMDQDLPDTVLSSSQGSPVVAANTPIPSFSQEPPVIAASVPGPSSQSAPVVAASDPGSSEALKICQDENCEHCKKNNLLYCLINFHACVYYKDQKCTFCGDLGWFLMQDNHIIDSAVHLNKGRKFCAFCDIEYDSLTKLQWHKCPAFISNSNSNSYDCIRCGAKLKSPFSLTKHMYAHCGFSKFSCHICNEGFYERIDLRKHEVLEHEKPPEVNVVIKAEEDVEEDEQQGALVVDEAEAKAEVETDAEQNLDNVCQKEICNKCFDNQSALGLLEFHYCWSPENPDECFVCSHIMLHMQNEKRNPEGVIHLKPCHVRCSFCHNYFTTIQGLKEHNCEVDVKAAKILCRECGVIRPSGEKFLLHTLHHYNVKPFTCKTCGERFVSSQRFKVHEKSHFAPRKFKCEVCSESFIHSREYVRHMFAHGGPKPYQCKTCSKSFAAKYMLTEHEKVHLAKRPYACTHCDRSYAKKRTLEMHIYNSHEGPQLICDICGKKLMNWSTMRTHIAVHDRENLHRCKLCFRAYTTQASLRRHTLTHTGEKKHSCSICGMNFYHTYQLKLHEITHATEKPHRCPMCIRTFTQRRQLVAHMPKCPLRGAKEEGEEEEEAVEVKMEVEVSDGSAPVIHLQDLFIPSEVLSVAQL